MKQWTRVLFVGGLIAAAAVACDDSSDGGSSNKGTGGASSGGTASGGSATGGTASGGTATGGSATTGGEAGMGGDTSTGGTAPTCEDNATGTAGAAGAAGASAVSDECADGCAVLSAPFTDESQAANFQFWLATTDMSTKTLTFRYYVKSGTGGGLQYGFRSGESRGYAGTYSYWANFAPAADGWRTVTVNMADYASAAAGNNPSSNEVEGIFVQLTSGSAVNGPWSDTVVYVDSIKSDDCSVNYEFSEADVGNLHAGDTNLAGSSVEYTTIDP